MDPPDEILAERRVDGPVLRDAGFACELRGPQSHVKVAFASLLKASMASVAFTVVDDNQFGWRKSLLKALTNFPCYRTVALTPGGARLGAVSRRFCAGAVPI